MLFVLEPDGKATKDIKEERTLIGCTCVFCRQTTEPFYVYPDDLQEWENGKLAKKAFPYLTRTEQEILITQICPDCQERILMIALPNMTTELYILSAACTILLALTFFSILMMARH